MNIQLNNCTFNESAKIGKVTYTYDTNIDKLFVDGYGINKKENIKTALSDFVTKLKQLQLWDKIQCINIPLLGTTVNEAFLNIKKSYGVENVFDTYPSGAFEIDTENKGIKGTSEKINYKKWPTTGWDYYTLKMTDFHMCYIGKEYKPTKNTQAILGNFKVSTYAEKFISNVCKSTSFKNTLLLDTTEYNVNVEKPVVVCFDSTTESMFNEDKFISTKSASIKDGNFKFYPFFHSIYADSFDTEGLFGIKYFSCGQKMSEVEMKLYYNMVNNLITTLLAEV